MKNPLFQEGSSETCKEVEQQYQKQLRRLIFPSPANFVDSVGLKNLLSNLKMHFSPSQHKGYLINHAFRNPYPEASHIYKQFFQQHYPAEAEPLISAFYSNQYFPKPALLGKFRQQPQKYQEKYVGKFEPVFFEQLDALFEQYGYVPHLERYLCFFPQYLVKQRHLQKQLLGGDKLGQQTTFFLCICAAAQIGCPYMTNRMLLKFLANGGKVEWVFKGSYPSKIRAILVTLNRKLARCVWDVNSDEIEQLIEQKGWTINELAFVVLLLSFIHAQCTIALGLGLEPDEKCSLINFQELDVHLKTYRSQVTPQAEGIKKYPLKQVLPSLKQMIEEMRKHSTPLLPKENPKKSFRKERKSSEEEEENVPNLQIESYMKAIGNELTNQNLVQSVLAMFKNFLPSFQPIQKRKDNKNNQFTCVEYNFQFKALPRLQHFTFTTQVIKKATLWLKEGEQMGLQNFGSETIGSTRQLRKAQRYYAENLCGFSHPEYDYKKYMTNILTMPLKFYIRLLMLSPLHIKRQVIDEIYHENQEAELFDLGHTAVLIAGAKFKLSVTLATYFMDY